MNTAYVDDVPVELPAKPLNCVQVAELAGNSVPHYCYHSELSVVASCRMCLVEVGELKDGKVLMQPKVVPGCQTPVKAGTVIVTSSYHTNGNQPLPYAEGYVPGARAKKSQADTLEGLLINHPLDCPVCDKAGECKLQDYSYDYGRAQTRMVDEKNTPPNKPDISSKITLFTDRCILCTRCVRFTREYAGTSELSVVGRGHHEEIDVFPGYPLENKLSGNVVDLCPVGALGSKDFLYSQRVWFLKGHAQVCTGCSTGCRIEVEENKNIIYRLKPRGESEPKSFFMCDEGRWGFKYHHSEARIVKAKVPAGVKPTSRTPHAAADLVKNAVTGAGATAGKPFALILSPFLTVEEAALAVKAVQALTPHVVAALGPVPVVGADDFYPKPAANEANHRFAIRAEKAPNKRGVEKVLKKFAKSVAPLDSLATKHPNLSGFLFVGGYPVAPEWDAKLLAALSAAPVRISIDLFPSALTEASDYVFPATGGYEKDGTYVNRDGAASALTKAVQPPHPGVPELTLFNVLLGRNGLARAADVRKELAASAEFAALGSDQFTATGYAPPA